MREIKFRAWDKTLKRIWNWEELINLPMGDFRRVLMDFQQFTGLLDKNGKEIYEGDAVIRYPEDVVSANAKIVKWINKHSLNGWNIAQGKYWEIVGNIYENPELLK